MSRWILLAGLLLAASPTAAQMREVELRSGPGRDLLESNCAACHTLNYIRMNAPFLNQSGWTAEVNKMINIFRAPIDAADVPGIIAYLMSNYGPTQ